ncbi:MAG TPA: hypothetical protein VFK41_03195 [Nocardioidaceae bacterium]|nr:hypothetical protein [Nocardioidaceae bacterium]
MRLASAALLAVALSALLLRVAFASLQRAEARLLEVRRRELRHRAWVDERHRLIAARRVIAEATSTTAGAVQLGTELTQAGHQAVAGVPFGIFEALPATREGSRKVRGVHDDIASAVYGGISAATEGFARLSRRRLTGQDVRPRDEDGSDPPAPPTRPAPRRD